MFTQPLFKSNPVSQALVLIAKDKNGKLFKLRWNYLYSEDRQSMITICKSGGYIPLYFYRIRPIYSEARLAA